MLFMVIERFRPGCVGEVYRRFRERGRLAPPSVRYVASRVDQELARCFQVMEAPGAEELAEWTRAWEDLVDFEVVPVLASEQAAAAVAARE